MGKLFVLAVMLGATLVLTSFTACSSKGSGGSHNYNNNNSMGYDSYYRSRVHHHRYRPGRRYGRR